MISLVLTLVTMHLSAPLAGQSVGGIAGGGSMSSGTPAVGPSQESAQPLQRRVSLDLKDVSLDEALEEIDRQAKLRLAYSPRAVPVDRRVTLRADSVTAAEALDRVLKGTGVGVTVTADGAVMLVRAPKKVGIEPRDSVGVVLGFVTDSARRPIVDAEVLLQGTSRKTVTNDKGAYYFADVPIGDYVLLARAIGYAPRSVPVALANTGVTRLDIALTQRAIRLAEVVTTATGERRRLELGNDIVKIRADSVMATQPVTSVTELLEGRVPGLVVQRSSGAPGDPARLRLRGNSSLYLNDDPIVVVDGVRAYAAQSDRRNMNLAGQGGFSAPSPLDYIDPHSIETIEVVKGPSAATLYGSDAANGVIVITTKKGRASPPQWTATVEYGGSRMPGTYPDQYLRWGHLPWDRTPTICPLTNRACIADSLTRFQTLSDPEATVLGRGSRAGANVNVSGGSDAVRYNVGASYSDGTGLLRLPEVEAARYHATHQTAAPEWMQRPQRLSQWGFSSRLDLKVGRKADVAFTAMVSETDQQRSSMERQLSSLMATYVDRVTGVGYRPGGSEGSPNMTVVPNVYEGYYQRVQARARQFTNGVNVGWRPLGWLTASADAGLNLIQRNDESLLPRGAVLGDTSGAVIVGRGNSLMGTVNVRATAIAPLPLGIKLQTALGINYTHQRSSDDVIQGRDLPPGGTNIGQAGTLWDADAFSQELSTFGWYLEPTIAHKRVWLSTGLRLDGGSSFGSRAKLAGFSKVSVSYLLSDEPFFPFKSVFNTLRLRAAYGEAGVQPRAGDRLRLYSKPSTTWVDDRFADYLTLATVGNTRIRPERGAELEGGFDADFLDDRLSVSLTAYRKTRVDALMQVPLPPSVIGGGSVLKNVGTIRNTGLEVALTAQVVRSEPVTLGAHLSVARHRNVVVELGPGVERFEGVVPGYPLFGRWGLPVLGYRDNNGDGIVERSEVLYGDTLVYLGRPDPEYTAALHPTLAIFRGTVAISAGFLYEHGMAQVRRSTFRVLHRGYNDPTAPLGEQAAVASSNTSDFLNTQIVSTLRFNSLSISYAVPAHVARFMGVRAATIALQGTNLGLHTNYRGLDPNVGYGNDAGQLPQPRTWSVRVSTSF